MNRRCLLLIILLVILPTALAEFTIDTQPEIISSCPTNINLFTIPVTNTGSEAGIYTVSLSGSGAKWAVAAPPGFVLSPGDSQTVFVYVTPAKNARVGSYVLNIIVSDGKESKSMTKTIIIRECFGVSLLVAEKEKTICSCEETDFLFRLKNTGEFAENYKLSLAGSASRWATTSKQFLRLQAGESEDIIIHVAPPCNNIGVFGLTLTARSETSEAIASANIGLGVEGCYDFGVYPEQNYYSFCENSELKIPITIENEGSSEDTYFLSTQGPPPSWVVLDRKEVKIPGGGGANVNLVAFPSYGISGNYPVKINVESEKGAQRNVADLNLNVLICYSTTLNLDAVSDSLCPEAESQHKLTLTNAGNFAETYSLTISGAEWASLSESSVVLEAGESKSIDLILSPRIDTEAGKYSIVITAKVQGTSGASDSATISVDILDKKDCFAVNILPEIKRTEVEYGGSSLIPITIENLGVQKVRYTLDISGNGVSYAQLNPSALEIEGGKSKKTYLYISVPDKTTEGRYSLIVSARDETGVVSSSSEITFDVIEESPEPSKSNITLPEFNITGITLAAVKDKISSSYNYLKEHWYWAIGIVVIIVLIIAGVIAKLSGTKEGEFIDEFYEKPTPKSKISSISRRKTSKDEKEKKEKLWKRFKDWLVAEDVEEFEVGWEVKKKPEPKKKEKNAWDRFVDWLEKEAPEKPKKKEKNAWDRFVDWLNAGEEDLFKPEPEEEIKPKKPAKKKEKGVWDKFLNWLEEEPIKKAPKTKKPKKKGKKGAWDKFLKWLEEE